MTNEEQELLIDYMVDAGELGPDGDLKAEFLDWYKVRGQTVSGEVHYKAALDAALDAARVRKRAFTALWTMSPPGRGLNPGTRPQNRSLCVEIWWQRSLLNPKAASVQRVNCSATIVQQQLRPCRICRWLSSARSGTGVYERQSKLFGPVPTHDVLPSLFEPT